MIETAHETAGDPDPAPASCATLDELVAEPERVASAADAAPVRIERPGAPALVLVSAAEFDRLTHPVRPRARHVSELTDRDLDRMRAQPVAPEAADLDHEGDFLGHG